MIEEIRFESASFNGLSVPVLIQSTDGLNEADAADGRIREPRAESREPRAESREPRAESREPRAESREPRAESREPRAESREPTAWSCSPWRSILRLSRCEPRRPPESSPAAPAGRGASLRSRKRRRFLAAFARAGRRSLAAALLLALALPAALLLLAGPAAAQEVVEVPRAWALTPSEISTDGKFRLLFVTSGTRAGNSGNIGDYNSFVQRQAGGGAEAIRRYASRFRALASTLPTAARDNTATTYTNDDKGVPIYWLGGDKVADDYEGFYDGSWDNKNGKGKNQSGNDFNSNSWIWSGTSDDGTSAPINRQFEQFTAPLGAAFSVSRIKLRDTETLLKIHQTGTATDSHHLFALSPVFKLAGSVKPFGVSITSAPANATLGYAMGETIQVRVDFGEAVTVTGAPYLVLNVGGVARTAVYDSGAGTRDLNFEYTVVRGETDADGVSLCADTMLDSGCGRITLNNGSITADSDSAAILLDLPDLGNQSGHKVDGVAEAKEVSITSTPADTAAGYAAGETIQVRVDFGEAVTVTGAPYLVLNVGGVARTAVYDPGSGARNLNFGYTVQAGDFDSNGISLCSSRLLDRDCGRITLDGGSIQANADNVAADLDLPELGNQSGHKVDGQPVTGSTPMTPAGAVAVPSGWDLVPPGVTRSFRLLFVSSTTRDATSSDINDYNNHVISAAGSGHSAIQAYKDGFRAIASTAAVDARDNAGLTGTGAPIYWLNGAKVAEKQQRPARRVLGQRKLDDRGRRSGEFEPEVRMDRQHQCRGGALL